jgi:hypothetical protein
MNSVGPNEPLSPEDKALYLQEYHHGADLFQRALEGYATSGDSHQKEAFKNVMNQALHVMNQAAGQLGDKEMKSQTEQISQDFAQYQDTGSQTAYQKLNRDLSDAIDT